MKQEHINATIHKSYNMDIVQSTRQDYHTFLSLNDRLDAWKIDAIRAISAWVESVGVIDCPMIRISTNIGQIERIRLTTKKELEVDLSDQYTVQDECNCLTMPFENLPFNSIILIALSIKDMIKDEIGDEDFGKYYS